MSSDLDPSAFARFAREAFRYDKPPQCLITPFGVFTWKDGAVEVMDYDEEGNLYPMTAEDQEAALRAFAERVQAVHNSVLAHAPTEDPAQPASERR